jgi:lambda family phage portal protein
MKQRDIKMRRRRRIKSHPAAFQPANGFQPPNGQTSKPVREVTNENIAPSRYRRKTWTVVGVAERDLPRFDRESAMAKTRQLVDNDPLMAGMVQTLVDNIVATGYTLRMTTNDTGYNKAVEGLWRNAKDSLDIRGVRSWTKICRCLQYRKIIDGDVGVYHNYIDVDTNEFHVQLIEADRIRSKKFDYLDQGIEFDDYGKPIRYWIGDRPRDQMDISAQQRKGTPIAAEDFYLYAHYPTERYDMLRGVTPLLPLLNYHQDIREIMNAMLQKIKNAAFMAFKTKITPSPTGTIFASEQDRTNEDGIQRRTTPIVPMSNVELQPGEDMEVMESNEPSPNVSEWIRWVMRYWGTAVGMPLEFMIFDLGTLNYSSARATLDMAKRRWRNEQESLTIPCDKIFRSWLNFTINTDGITPPDSIEDPFSHRWGKPVWPYINPQEEIQAQGLALQYGLTTAHRLLSDHSDLDFDELIAERKREVEAYQKAGIPVSVGVPGSQALAAGTSNDTQKTKPESMKGE